MRTGKGKVFGAGNKALANRICPYVAGSALDAVGVAENMIVVTHLPKAKTVVFLEVERRQELKHSHQF